MLHISILYLINICIYIKCPRLLVCFPRIISQGKSPGSFLEWHCRLPENKLGHKPTEFENNLV